MRILILGGAVSGRAAAGLATRLGYEVTGYDRSPSAAARMRAEGLSWTGGEWTPALLSAVDVVVTSPGVAPMAPPIVDTIAAGTALWSELEFAARHTDATLAAVTGTNGKTSTVTAAALMLEESGVKACAAGNIGTALSDAFHPRAAAILNVSPDHLDWHRTFDAYADAKARITSNQIPSDLLAFGADDPAAAGAANVSRAEKVPVSANRVPEGGAGVVAGRIRIGPMDFEAPDLPADFLEDAVVGAVLARKVGATEQGIRRGFSRFRPGPHRRALVGEWQGVQWVDDSKATNPHAAVAAANGFESVVLIAGGQNKGLDLSPMAMMPTVRHVFSIGETAEELGRIFDGRPVTITASLSEAVAGAEEVAERGDTVLLAPGCASFDMFASYGARGDEFRRLVLARMEAGSGN
jgi:UDP-N-acetylmuramoylalanine--D-glutamate ligase